MKKQLLIFCGWFFVVIGVLGIFLPLLPATPFFLLAAACFYKSSPKFYNWLINNKFLGSYIKNYKKNKGMPLKAKIYALVLLNGSIAYSIYLFRDILYMSIILLTVAVGVSILLLSIKTTTEFE